MLDVVIIGGGPAGMSAALVAGRGKQRVLLLDEEKPRNAVTKASHAFLTRDGITPTDFREKGRRDLLNYPNISIENDRVIAIDRLSDDTFELTTQSGATLQSKRIVLATGLKETLPEVKAIEDYYGTSIFSCPFCDGWEMKDRSLILILESAQAFHMISLINNWTDDLVLATNGHYFLDSEQKETLKLNNIRVFEEKISALEGTNGQLGRVTFENGETLIRTGGFCATNLDNKLPFIEQLGIAVNDFGYITTDMMGHTNIPGIYAAGEITGPSQLIVSASQGHMAGIGIIADSSDAQFRRN